MSTEAEIPQAIGGSYAETTELRPSHVPDEEGQEKNEAVTCKHCNQTYLDPVQLPCGHILCRDRCAGKKIKFGFTLCCPICHRKIYLNQGVKELPSATEVVAILKELGLSMDPSENMPQDKSTLDPVPEPQLSHANVPSLLSMTSLRPGGPQPGFRPRFDLEGPRMGFRPRFGMEGGRPGFIPRFGMDGPGPDFRPRFGPRLDLRQRFGMEEPRPQFRQRFHLDRGVQLSTAGKYVIIRPRVPGLPPQRVLLPPGMMLSLRPGMNVPPGVKLTIMAPSPSPGPGGSGDGDAGAQSEEFLSDAYVGGEIMEDTSKPEDGELDESEEEDGEVDFICAPQVLELQGPDPNDGDDVTENNQISHSTKKKKVPTATLR